MLVARRRSAAAATRMTSQAQTHGDAGKPSMQQVAGKHQGQAASSSRRRRRHAQGSLPEHPDGDGQWQPDQQAGDEVFAHGQSPRRERRQWQAQEPPQAVPPPARPEPACGRPTRQRLPQAAAALAAAEPPRRPLKSVAYQPEPLSWKPARSPAWRRFRRRRPGRWSAGHRRFLQHVLGVATGAAAIGVIGMGRGFKKKGGPLLGGPAAWAASRWGKWGRRTRFKRRRIPGAA